MVIDRYDETLVDQRAVNLTNKIDSINVSVPVGFGYPTGSFQLSEDAPITFTHFIAAVPSAGGAHVFKISRLNCINQKVTEYFYELDYLKDYWTRHSGGTSLHLPTTLLSSYWDYSNQSVLDHNIYPVNQHVSNEVLSIQRINSFPLTALQAFIIVNTPEVSAQDTFKPRKELIALQDNGKCYDNKVIYCIDDIERLTAFNKSLLGYDFLSPQTPASYPGLYNNIDRIFFAPTSFEISTNEGTSTTWNNATCTATNVMYFSKADGTTGIYDVLGGSNPLHDHFSYITLPTSSTDGEYTGIVQRIVNLSNVALPISNANDLPPYKKFQIYIPYIGWHDIPTSELFVGVEAYENHNILVKYLIDLIHGQIACQLGLNVNGNQVWSSYITPFVSLPSYNVMTSQYASNLERANIQYQADVIKNSITSISKIFNPISLSNPLATAASLGVGLTTGIANSTINYDQAISNSSLTPINSGKNADAGLLDRRFKVIITTYKTGLDFYEAKAIYGVPLNEYRDYIALDNNDKAWLNTTNSIIQGPNWYAEQVRSEYNKDYITYINAS